MEVGEQLWESVLPFSCVGPELGPGDQAWQEVSEPHSVAQAGLQPIYLSSWSHSHGNPLSLLGLEAYAAIPDCKYCL